MRWNHSPRQSDHPRTTYVMGTVVHIPCKQQTMANGYHTRWDRRRIPTCHDDEISVLCTYMAIDLHLDGVLFSHSVRDRSFHGESKTNIPFPGQVEPQERIIWVRPLNTVDHSPNHTHQLKPGKSVIQSSQDTLQHIQENASPWMQWEQM